MFVDQVKWLIKGLIIQPPEGKNNAVTIEHCEVKNMSQVTVTRCLLKQVYHTRHKTRDDGHLFQSWSIYYSNYQAFPATQTVHYRNSHQQLFSTYLRIRYVSLCNTIQNIQHKVGRDKCDPRAPNISLLPQNKMAFRYYHPTQRQRPDALAAKKVTLFFSSPL